MNEVPTWIEFLTMIAGGGFVPVIVAFLLEHIKPFQDLPPEAKKWTVLALFVVLPVVATVLLEFVPAGVWAQFEPYWKALALGFVGWLASQVTHAWDTRRKCSR